MILKVTTFAFLFSSILFGSVAPNPFLKPGSNRKPPPPNKPVFKPKAIVRPDVAKELEFKGYFILKGQVYFSLFNKKVNHGEWIKISEKTYEEFSAHKFDLETEILTILYEGQTFDLKLLQSKSTNGLSSPKGKVPILPKSIPGLSKSKTPRVMPPKPKINPVIPSFLVNKSSIGKFNEPKLGASSGGSSPSSPRSMLPGLPYPGFVPRRNTTSTPGFNSSDSTSNSANNTNTGGLVTSNNSQSGGSGSFTNNGDIPDPNEQNNNSVSDEIDLSSLPPPPPPPNILPPSPPPNIVPSREE